MNDECWTAWERADKLCSKAADLGLDAPTFNMIAEAIRDAEWNALWNPVTIAEQHNQDMREMRRIWNKALGANVVEESELISERDWSHHLRIQLAAEVEKVNKLNERVAYLQGVIDEHHALNSRAAHANEDLSDDTKRWSDTDCLEWLLPRQYDHKTRESIYKELAATKTKP